ncbi:MAG: universal stress protein [Haloarculaceae archaeon]
MVDHVLVPVDDSPLAETALDFALAEFPDAHLTLLHVINPVEGSYAADPTYGDVWYDDQWFDTARDRAEDLLDDLTEQARDHAGTVDAEWVVGRPAREIVSFAEDNDVDHVVMGSHGRTGFDRILVGSVAETVMRRSPAPVTVVR